MTKSRRRGSPSNRPLQALALGAAAAIAGCVVEADVGQACAPFVVNEVAFSNSRFDVPVTGAPTDYIELAPEPGHEGVVDLRGYVVFNADLSQAVRLGDFAQLANDDPLRPAFLVLVTTQYDYASGCTPDPADGAADACTQVLGFDFNNDAAEFEVMAPTPDPEAWHSCVRVVVPDAHKNASWQREEDGDWCYADSTPGTENERCLCEKSDEC